MKTTTAKRFLLAGLLFSPLVSWGQTTKYTLTQGFEVAEGQNEVKYTQPALDPGKTYSGLVATTFTSQNAAPKASNLCASGARGFGVENNTGGGGQASTITFETIRPFTSNTDNYLRFKLASIATNSQGGLDNDIASNGVQVNIAYNGSSTFTPTLQINGDNNRGVIFDCAATGVYTTSVSTPNPTITRIQSGGGTAGLATIRINFGPAITRVQVQFVLRVNGKSAVIIDDVTIGSDNPLPVELTAFDAIRQNNAVLLKWATASEQNNDRFEVQRSADGQRFVTISTVRGSGTTGKSSAYTTKDTEPLATTSYYRLRQIDQDGSATFSPVRVVGAFLALVYPSPTYDLLNLPPAAVGAHYRVYNTLGQTMLHGIVPTSGALNVRSLVAGSYLVEVGDNKNRTSQRFVRGE